MAATLLPDAPAAPVSTDVDARRAGHPGAPSRHAGRFAGVTRPYTTADVERLRCSVRVEHTLARVGAERLWGLLTERDYVHALGALTGGQAVQMVKAGLEAIYLSGWQVAADANLAGQTYPDQSLYPATRCRTWRGASTRR
jgi:isocitrate lyase